MTADETDGVDGATVGRRLGDATELLFRQVHPQWIVDGEPSSQAFKPTKKDAGMLSISLGSKTTAHDALTHHTQVLKLASGGTWAVTVGEVAEVALSSYEQPLEDSPAHGFIDFRGLGRGASGIKSQAPAREEPRPRLHVPTSDVNRQRWSER